MTYWELLVAVITIACGTGFVALVLHEVLRWPTSWDWKDTFGAITVFLIGCALIAAGLAWVI